MKLGNSKEENIGHKVGEVVSVVSHQLKTPLSVTKGYLEVLLSGDMGSLTDGQREYLTDALENTNRMVNLVKDLLDVSRIEQGKMEFQPRITDLKELIDETIKGFAFLAKAQNCWITFSVKGEIPMLSIDSLKIKQVISNFIDNALNYSKGRSSIILTLKKAGKNIVFSCQDNGVGISNEGAKKVFTKFFRSEEAIGLEPTGSGLGLFIAKAIIEKSGGKIWFKTKQSEGTTFFFSLPIK